MTWFESITRWLKGLPPTPPPEVHGETSVLFCLQSHSPMSFAALREASTITPHDLGLVLEKLEWDGRITSAVSWHGGVKKKMYSIVHK